MYSLKKQSRYDIIKFSFNMNLEDEYHGTALGRTLYEGYG